MLLSLALKEILNEKYKLLYKQVRWGSAFTDKAFVIWQDLIASTEDVTISTEAAENHMVRGSKPPKKRAIELYHRDTPFKPKVVEVKKRYDRKRNKKEIADDLDH